jgi:menaquinone-specific isochorismate synthase
VVEPALVRESDGDGEAIWTRTVRAGLERIRSGALRKIVLARTRSYTASGQLDPVSVLMRLASREIRGFRFLMEAGEGKSFLGVTPERLISRSGRIARSEAVAGTRPRGVDGVADRLLGESLLASAKDRREHELVVERVREALTSCSTTLRIDAEPRLLRLAYVQHLATRVQAEIRTGVTDIDLVRLLHPTPAVAGAPVAAAIEALRALEPFDRGLYAGPVGVVSRDGAEIAVAIRSARIDGDRLTAYAGAGIVDGSDPADEWRETGHKLLAFERLAT